MKKKLKKTKSAIGTKFFKEGTQNQQILDKIPQIPISRPSTKSQHSQTGFHRNRSVALSQEFHLA